MRRARWRRGRLVDLIQVGMPSVERVGTSCTTAPVCSLTQLFITCGKRGPVWDSCVAAGGEPVSVRRLTNELAAGSEPGGSSGVTYRINWQIGSKRPHAAA